VSRPPEDAKGVAAGVNVSATFSEDMQSATVKSAFKLFKKGSTTKIAAASNYDDATDAATLNPTNNLRRGVTYKAVITTVAKDTAGNQLDQNPTLDGPRRRSGSSR
jgi:post-segregation antitoxin (ccd killing protein)